MAKKHSACLAPAKPATARPEFEPVDTGFDGPDFTNEVWALDNLFAVRIATVTLRKTPAELEEMVRKAYADGDVEDVIVAMLNDLDRVRKNLLAMASWCESATARLIVVGEWVEVQL